MILQRYVRLVAGVGAIVCAQHAAAQQIVTTARVSIDSDSMTSVLNRLVTVRVHNVTLRQAVDAIASAAQTRVQYQNSILDAVSQPVSLRVVQVRLAQAFTAVLSGTSLQVVPLGRDVVSIELAGDSTQHGTGAILGTVTDVNSKEPIPAANVTILGTNIHVLTDANGQFRVAGVAEGVSVVRVTRLGLQPREQRVAVVANQTVRVAIPLTRVAQSLEQVVTTATGDRRRLEVGNSIGTINADSIVPTTLIRNMSDLLQARTPGVVVSNTGGSVGAPSRIRIRGINSIQLNNDPVIIVDGVRLQSQTTGGSTYSPTGTQGTSLNSGSVLINDNQQFGFAPSRLDDIDPNSIESIDVLKGPSAASLYGTDAANGVIVIKTKHGQPGRWRLSATGDDGWSAIPGSMPAMWYGWGHSVDNYSLVTPGSYQMSCTLTSVDALGPVYTVTDNTCVQDSVTSWSPLNDKYLTTIGTGTSRSLSASLSGGTDQLTEFLSGRGGNDVGLAKMSDAERSRFTQTLAQDIPSWMLHPNTQQTYNLTSRTSIKVGSAFDLGLTGEGTYRDVLNAGTGLPTGANYSQYQGVTSPADTLWYLPSETQLVKGSSLAKRATGAATGNYRPFGWLALHGTLGDDYTLRSDQALQLPMSCLDPSEGLCANYQNSSRADTRDENTVLSTDVGALMTFTPLYWLGLKTAIGEQYVDTRSSGLTVQNGYGTTLAFGSQLLSPTPIAGAPGTELYGVTEYSDESATAGWYLEQTVTLRERLFLTAGFRKDVASGFGKSTNDKAPVYPKLSLSWLASDEPFFPHTSFISSFRLRAAYGHSGNQTRQNAVLGTYVNGQTTVLGSVQPGIVRSDIGNTNLKPERTEESEGGFDLSMFNNERIHAEFTLYRKLTRDAIVTVPLAPSYGTSQLSENIGSVENRGVELLLTAKVIDHPMFSWDATVNVTRNTNKLVTEAPNLTQPDSWSQFRAGYPLYGFWIYKVKSYNDLNGDHMLGANEIAFTDTAVYVGSSQPKAELTYSNTFSFFNGRLRIGANFDQILDMINPLPAGASNPIGSRALVDRTTPLAQQAAAVEAMRNEEWLLPASSVRFQELSLTYTVPAPWARLFKAQSAAITLAGRNLALWSNYAGKDMDVASDQLGALSDDIANDNQQLPQPRNWTLRFNVEF